MPTAWALVGTVLGGAAGAGGGAVPGSTRRCGAIRCGHHALYDPQPAAPVHRRSTRRVEAPRDDPHGIASGADRLRKG